MDARRQLLTPLQQLFNTMLSIPLKESLQEGTLPLTLVTSAIP